MLKAWEGVFPGLVKPVSDVTTSCKSHFRYPQDLFEVQRSLLVRYHVDDPVDFFQSSGFWKVPNDPTVSEAVQAPQPPYYLQVKTPGLQTSEFQLTSVLTGFQREFMSAYVSASSDPANYGKLTVLVLPTSTQTPGPTQVQQLFRTTQEISSLVTLSTQQGGSRVIFGNLLTLPVNDGLLYVEPFYIQGQSSSSSYPQLNKVLVWYAGRVGVGNTLKQALANAASSTPVQTPAIPGDASGIPGHAVRQHGAVDDHRRQLPRRRPIRQRRWPPWTRRPRRSMPPRRPEISGRSARRARSWRTRLISTWRSPAPR